MSKLYKITKDIKGRKRRRNSNVTDRDGVIFQKDKKVIERWREHFVEDSREKSRKRLQMRLKLRRALEEMQIEENPSKRTEIVKSMWGGRVAGIDVVRQNY